MSKQETMKDRLNEVKREKNYRLVEIHRGTGISQSQLGRIFSGETENPGPVTISTICKFLQVNEEWVVNGTGSKEIKLEEPKGDLFLEWKGEKVPADVIAMWVAENEEHISKHVIIRNLIDLKVTKKLMRLTSKGGDEELRKFLGY